MTRIILSAAVALLVGAGGVASAAVATPDELETLPGFKVDLVLAADAHQQGSWISMARDDQGRLLLAGQRGQPITRVTLDDGKPIKVEALHLPVSEGMGMLCVGHTLYVDGSDGRRFGLWRFTSTTGDDTYDHVELLREWRGGSGEHGAHAILLAPDKKHLYTVCGNFTDLPTDLLPSSPHRNYADDRVLPRAEDGNGFGAGKKPPGGFVCRMDLDGKNPELFASGERNTYDIAFNPDSELFAFDSDMEWDWGTAWYRPIRINHVVSGSDGGFREGTAKWPEYYPDSVPPIKDIGLGSPTGLIFGQGAKFPAKYQRAFYVCDWAYGRLIAAHLRPDGATYSATWENFVAPKSLKASTGKVPLNLTDVVIGADGALYFTIGGRSTASALYRVSYVGNESTAPVDVHDSQGAQARDQRHRLEEFQGHQDPQAVAIAWPFLGSKDRSMRYAARLAIESQPVNEWESKATAETDPQAAMTALLALARLGGQDAQPDLFKALARFPISSLPEQLQFDKLRVIEVSICRQGKPTGELARSIIGELDPIFPASVSNRPLNVELCQVLLVLDAPDAVAKTMKLLESVPTQEEQTDYVLFLRTIRDGWNPELRKQYFSWWTQDFNKTRHPAYVLQWFADVGTPYRNGASFENFVAHFHADAEKTLTPQERQSLQSVLAAYVPPGAKPNRRQPKARPFVKNWTMADLEPALAQVSHGRSFRRGKQAFEDSQCLSCHKFKDEGGAIGPDLTAISSRYTRRDVLDSIIEPSKVISEQYANTTFRTKNGDIVEGRVLEENGSTVVVRPNPLEPDKTVTLKKSDLNYRGLSKLSPMPQGLVDNLKKNEILDLLAYLESGGNPNHPDFKRTAPSARPLESGAAK